jgi:hypothetical protein
MIKLQATVDDKGDLKFTAIERETTFIHKTRPICVSLLPNGVKVWLKGKRDFYVVPYDTLFIDGERGSVSIKPRR